MPDAPEVNPRTPFEVLRAVSTWITLAGVAMVIVGFVMSAVPVVTLGTVLVVAHSAACAYAGSRDKSTDYAAESAMVPARSATGPRILSVALIAWHFAGTMLTLATVDSFGPQDAGDPWGWPDIDAVGPATYVLAISTLAAVIAYPLVAGEAARRVSLATHNIEGPTGDRG